jgi:ABC-type Mn2+/Zn2+ transport system permease subunit
VPLVMVAAVAIGSCCAVVGLLISYHHATATGATMALATVVVFLIALLVRQAGRGLTQRTWRLGSEHG